MTREDEEQDRARSRTYNLSWRSELSKAEKIIEGKPFNVQPSGASAFWFLTEGPPPDINIFIEELSFVSIRINDY